MTPTGYLLALMRCCIFFMWSATAAVAVPLATRVALSPLLTDPLVLSIAALIATAAGVTTLFMRINALLSAPNPQPMVRPWSFAVAHIGGSYLAGGLGLLGSSIRGTDADEALLAVLLASFIGAKALEVVAERWLAVVRLSPPANTPQG